ncbi:MAG: hypothetical protein RQ862_06365 [Candidatus Caldarchaeales archaeon]|jgi:uncharacterized membrane protein HdeD (DUF308 family)|nr:hypothetical protein [Candidatus Caldarchaeales archaeon]
MSTKTRPTGVTILAVLEIIGGIFSLLAAAAFFALGALVGEAGMGMVEELPGIGFLAGALAALLGGVFIIAGLVAFLLAYGFWTGRGWAWILGIIFSIVGIVLGVVSLLGNSASIVGILINILIIYYLTRTHVKEWFGRA